MRAALDKVLLDFTPLHQQTCEDAVFDALAATLKNGEYEKACHLLRLFRVDVNRPFGLNGYKLLSYASTFYHTKQALPLFELLLEQGALIDGVNSYGQTALMLVIFNSSLSAIKYLIDRGASLNHSDFSRHSIMDYACFSKKIPLKVVKYLVERGATIDIIANETTPLVLACEQNLFEKVKYLVDSGASLDLLPGVYRTPLGAAAGRASLDVVKYLVNNGASVNQRFCDLRMTPLHAAVINCVEVVQFLIDAGANVNALYDNKTPLDYAADNATDLNIIVCLVKAGGIFDCMRYTGATDNITAYLKQYPLHHLEAFTAKLKDELVDLQLGKEEARALLWKTDLKADFPLDNLFALPYHLIPKGVAEFLRRVGEQPFYENLDGVECAHKELEKTLDALARVAHTSELVREAEFTSWGIEMGKLQARIECSEPPTKRTK